MGEESESVREAIEALADAQKAIEALGEARAALRVDPDTSLERQLLAEEIGDILRRLKALR